MELIIILFVVGIVLLLIEIYLTPGATIFGLIGIVAIIVADFYAVSRLESPWNWLFVVGSLVLTVGFLYLLFRVLQSKNFSVHSEIKSRVNVLDPVHFQVGEEGKTITVLRPNGRAIFGDQITEVYSMGEYIEDETPVKIIKRTADKLFVQQIN